MNTALLVVDMQNGFVTEECRVILPNVKALIDTSRKRNHKILFTKFINEEDSGYVKWIGWRRLMHSPETDLIPELIEYDSLAHHKTQYSSFTPEVEALLRTRQTDRVVLCGVATDGCVLKTAVDAFERGIEPIVAVDACHSHAGREVHEAGLLLLGRFIGKRQLRTTAELLSSDFGLPGASVGQVKV